MECGIHAREWISPLACLYIIRKLLYKRSGTAILNDGWEFTIVPLANPDGYEHTWAKPENRMWRKNRRINKIQRKCQGVDLNRNFPVGWKAIPNKDKHDPCEVSYPGVYPLSEPESRTMAQLMESGDFMAYFSFHSYSRLILMPYAYKEDKISNLDAMTELIENMKKAMEKKKIQDKDEPEKYQFGSPSEVLYSVRGSSILSNNCKAEVAGSKS